MQPAVSVGYDPDGGGGSHRAMVQSELPVSVLSYDQDGEHLFATTPAGETPVRLRALAQAGGR
jgi:hypothetical protein